MINKTFTGKLTTNPKGFGFVLVKDKEIKSIFIPKTQMKNAIDGDLVEVQIKNISPKGPEGEILKIIKREKTEFVGIVTTKDHDNYIAFVPQLGISAKAIFSSKKKLKIGDRLKLKALRFKKNKIICKMTKYLSHISESSKDIEAALCEYNIKESFSKKTLGEIKELKITKEELKKRKDLTHLQTLTIDPKDAKDFDDALSISKDENNNFNLYVHISDVAHFVKPNTSIDNEAKTKANSTYFPGKCIPMLPKKLSNDLCSLKPNQIRLTMTVIMKIDTKGNLLSYEIVRSFIKSKKRLAYEEAKNILTSKKNHKYKKTLLLMVEVFNLLKNKRFERGSIDIAISENKIIVDSNENPIKIITIPYDITHQLIEEFMLKTNEIVATHLSNLNKSLIYRIHEEPSYQDFKDFYDLSKSLGFPLPSTPNQNDIQNLFLKAKDTKFFHLLSINFIKSLKLAIYSKENIGHFGLSLKHYTHFTSPIRRYSDLIIQRILFDEQTPLDIDEIASNCSEKERNSFKAENSVITLKKLRLLKKDLKKDKEQIFTATIAKVKPHGIYFELDKYFLEGYLSLSELKDDYYNYNKNSLKLIGSHITLSFADKIKVKINNVNLIFLEIEFKYVKKSFK